MSASVTKLPARFDILNGSPFLSSRTIWTSLTSNFLVPPVSAATAALIRLTVPAWSALPDVDQPVLGILRLLDNIGEVGAEIVQLPSDFLIGRS